MYTKIYYDCDLCYKVVRFIEKSDKLFNSATKWDIYETFVKLWILYKITKYEF